MWGRFIFVCCLSALSCLDFCSLTELEDLNFMKSALGVHSVVCEGLLNLQLHALLKDHSYS